MHHNAMTAKYLLFFHPGKLVFGIICLCLMVGFAGCSRDDDWIQKEEVWLPSPCKIQTDDTLPAHSSELLPKPPQIATITVPLTVSDGSTGEAPQASDANRSELRDIIRTQKNAGKPALNSENTQKLVISSQSFSNGEQCVNLNTDTVQAIETLSGIGPAKARMIVAQRDKRPFKRWKEVTKIKGIGPKTYKRFQHQLCAEP